ncbi:hypothetical protein [Lysobacter panacisoli]|uniref:hypothetical protein n=1 Tax=Lysobacter panacisoli TaxID=1255263 RepID=UPI0031E57683
MQPIKLHRIVQHAPSWRAERPERVGFEPAIEAAENEGWPTAKPHVREQTQFAKAQEPTTLPAAAGLS